jgi:hypothetical protein
MVKELNGFGITFIHHENLGNLLLRGAYGFSWWNLAPCQTSQGGTVTRG